MFSLVVNFLPIFIFGCRAQLWGQQPQRCAESGECPFSPRRCPEGSVVALTVASGFLEVCVQVSRTPSTHHVGASKGQIYLHDLFSLLQIEAAHLLLGGWVRRGRHHRC